MNLCLKKFGFCGLFSKTQKLFPCLSTRMFFSVSQHRLVNSSFISKIFKYPHTEFKRNNKSVFPTHPAPANLFSISTIPVFL